MQDRLVEKQREGLGSREIAEMFRNPQNGECLNYFCQK